MFDNFLSSKFYEFCTVLTRFIYLTILFLIFSLPFITLGASLTALTATVRQPDYPTFGMFFKTFRENILRGTVIMIFTGFTIIFLAQFWQLARVIRIGNIILIFLTIFLIVYNLNAYLFVSILKKSNITFFRQVFFFTIGTIYKTFFVPIIALGLAFVLPIIGGWPLLLMGIPMILAIYVRMVKNDVATVLEVVKVID